MSTSIPGDVSGLPCFPTFLFYDLQSNLKFLLIPYQCKLKLAPPAMDESYWVIFSISSFLTSDKLEISEK